MSCEDEHYHGHSHSNGHDGHDHSHVPPEETSSAQLLNSKINIPLVTALNTSNKQDDVHKLFKNSSERYSLRPVVRSDADEQMIIHIPFLNGSVKLHSLVLRTNGDLYCPRVIKLWKNKDIDFSNCSDKATYLVEHPQVGVNYNSEVDTDVPEILVGDDFVEHHLPRHIFTGVHTLTVFIEKIHGDEEESHLHYIELRGEFTQLNRDPVVTIYELAANPADHQKVEDVMVSYGTN